MKESEQCVRLEDHQMQIPLKMFLHLWRKGWRKCLPGDLSDNDCNSLNENVVFLFLLKWNCSIQKIYFVVNKATFFLSATVIWFCVEFFVIIGTCSRDSKGFCNCDCCRPAIWAKWYNAWKSFGSKIWRSQDFGILGCPMRDCRESTMARFCNLERS